MVANLKEKNQELEEELRLERNRGNIECMCTKHSCTAFHYIVQFLHDFMLL